MNLREYIDQNYGGSVNKFSKSTQIDRAAIYRAMGGSDITLRRAFDFVRVTDGQVTLEDLKK